jgi:hypothetical protein
VTPPDTTAGMTALEAVALFTEHARFGFVAGSPGEAGLLAVAAEADARATARIVAMFDERAAAFTRQADVEEAREQSWAEDAIRRWRDEAEWMSAAAEMVRNRGDHLRGGE